MRMQIINEVFNTDVEFDGTTYKIFDKTTNKFRLLTTIENKNIDALVKSKVFAELQTAKISELETKYNNANELDISYLNTTFQADKASQDLIVSVLSAGSVPTGFFWLDKANNQVSMTYAQLQGLSGAILTRNQTNFIKFQTLKAKVKLAKTQADLDKIVW